MKGGYEREDTTSELEAQREAARRKAEERARSWEEKPLPKGAPGSRFFPNAPTEDARARVGDGSEE
jgi:hypothetical protein